MSWLSRTVTRILAPALLTASTFGGVQVSEAGTLWNPQIAIVWPYDSQGHQTAVANSSVVNVSVWPTNQVNCDRGPNPPLDLFVAKNNEPVQSVGVSPQTIQRTVNGVVFPSEEFNRIPAKLLGNSSAKYTFVSYFKGQPQSNVWIHAADPRTYLPQQIVPTGYSEPSPKELDTRIQVVWPHDESGNFAPVNRATRVNIAIDIFAHGTTLSVPSDADYVVNLWWNQGNAALALAPGRLSKTTYTVNGKTFPRWVLNDFPVRPDQQYHFLAITGAIGQPGASYPTIWTHAADARTIQPNPLPPAPCAS